MSCTGHVAWLDRWGSPEWLSKNSLTGSAGQVGHVDAGGAATPPTPALGALQPRAGPAAATAPHVQSPPTAATKELLRLRKKLREIAKIEERLEAGLQIDALQGQKVQSKGEMASRLAEAERLVAEETAAIEEGEQSRQVALWRHEGEQMLMSPAEAEKQATAAHLGAIQPFMGPVIFGETSEQQHWQQQQLLQQQVSCIWPVYGLQQLVLPLGHFEPSTPLQPQAWAVGRAELSVQPDTAGKSTGTRLHLHRKCAARPGRKGAALASPENCSEELGRAKLAEGLEAGGEARAVALMHLQGSVARLAFDSEGCRIVQLAIQVAEQAAAAKLVQELHGHVQEAMKSAHANYVLQTVVVSLPTAMSGFVVRELLGAGVKAARHRFGCRILCRLIEHSGTSADLAELLQEVLAKAEELCRHPFAHFVMQSILEHLPEYRARVTQSLHADLLSNACHRCASHVVETALEHCAEEDRQGLALELSRCPENVVAMAQSYFGQFALRAVLQLPGAAAEPARGQVAKALPLMADTKYGQQLMKDLGITADLAV